MPPFPAPRLSALAAILLCLALSSCNSPQGSRTGPQTSKSVVRNFHPNHRESRPSLTADSAGGSFDFYLLNLSWSPEFCATHPGRSECAQHLAFVLHGLWPQTNDGGHPEHCSDASGPYNPSLYRDIYPDSGLLQHEWQTHGTCSGLAPDDFFNLARKAVHLVAIPHQLTSLDHPISMAPTTILDLFSLENPSFPRQSLALTCANNYLTAIELCLTKDLRPVVCPRVRSCRASIVRIPPPNLALP